MIDLRKISYWISLLVLVVLILFSNAPALAAVTIGTISNPVAINNQNVGEALEIAPPLVYLNANPGQTITTQIQVRDIAKGDLLVTGQADDFVAAGTNGNPKILFHDNAASDPFSLKNWIAPLPGVVLKPEQINSITVTINVPKNATPGGHYGLIRFSAVPPSLSGKNGVSLSASLGTLILLTVSGHIKQKMSLTKFYSNNSTGQPTSFFQSDPLGVSETFKNDGNVAEQPQGQMTIKDMFGKTLVTMSINPVNANVLPASTRIFTQTINSIIIGNRTLFGRYSATLNVSYGNHQTLSSKLTFWVIPVVPILILLVALVVGFFLLRWLIKRYNQHILDKAKKTESE